MKVPSQGSEECSYAACGAEFDENVGATRASAAPERQVVSHEDTRSPLGQRLPLSGPIFRGKDFREWWDRRPQTPSLCTEQVRYFHTDNKPVVLKWMPRI